MFIYVHHQSAADHKESADINYALMALKDCFRSYYNTSSSSSSSQKELNSSSSNILDEKTKLINYKKILSMRPIKKAPYRSSLLTRVLRNCFVPQEPNNSHTYPNTSRPHLTCVIATISPSSSDIVHTINTLDHVSMMIPRLLTFISK